MAEDELNQAEPTDEESLGEAADAQPPALDSPHVVEGDRTTAPRSLARRAVRIAYYGALLASVAILALVAVATAPALFGYHTYVVEGGGAAISAGTADEALFTVPLAGYVLDLSSAWPVRLLLAGVPVCLIALGYAQVLLRLLPDREANERAAEELASAASARLQARKAQLRLVERPESISAEQLPVFLTGQLRGQRSLELQASDPAGLDDLRAA
ncbi:MAG: hypothetical protein WD939_08815 [Dehalococcoidia bacterium]